MEFPLWFPSSTGTELSALFVIPEGWLNVPVTILCRGDASPLADGQDLQIARQLQERGIASLLLDFSSAGQRVTELTQSTLEGPIEDLGSAIDELRLQRGVDVGRIGVGGSDIAGTVALLRASFDPRIRALVLRATPAPTTQLPTGPVSAPTLLIVGDDDTPVLAGVRSLEKWFTGPSEFLFVPNAGHHFGTPEAFAMAREHTVSWFVRHLGTGVRVRTTS
jgi:putative phosphoribosyl transferase